MAARAKAIVIHEQDNVATAIMPLKAGSAVSLDVRGRPGKIKVLSSIPLGHKFALCDIELGSDVLKYGESIGKATARIARGEHVHVHNVVSHRGRKEGT